MYRKFKAYLTCVLDNGGTFKLDREKRKALSFTASWPAKKMGGNSFSPEQLRKAKPVLLKILATILRYGGHVWVVNEGKLPRFGFAFRDYWVEAHPDWGTFDPYDGWQPEWGVHPAFDSLMELAEQLDRIALSLD